MPYTDHKFVVFSCAAFLSDELPMKYPFVLSFYHFAFYKNVTLQNHTIYSYIYVCVCVCVCACVCVM